MLRRHFEELPPGQGSQIQLPESSAADNSLCPAIKRTRVCESVELLPPPFHHAGSGSKPSDAVLKEKKIRVSPEPVDAGEKPFSFDFHFVSSDQDVVSTLEDITRNHEDSEVILMSRPDGLDRDNLTHRLAISHDGRHQLRAGKLFQNDSPVTLVLDIRNMTAEELTGFNDLLDPDQPSLYDKETGRKRPVGAHVFILVLASPEQLTNAGSDDSKAPGADFWRRVNRPGNTWREDRLEAGFATMETDHPEPVPEYPGTTYATVVTINLHRHCDWRRLLFGGPGTDDSGRIRHIPGELERLKPDQVVLLRGADWSDLEFQQHMRGLVERRQYESNGTVCVLPEGVRFFREEVRDDELGKLCHSSVSLTCQRPEKTVIINQTNLSQWLNAIKIDERGFGVPNTTLLEQLAAGATITVTSPLSQSMWFMLLERLQAVHEQTRKKPELFLACTRGQPEQLRLPSNYVPEKPHHVSGESGPRAITYDNESQVSDWIQAQDPAPLVIQVNARTNLGQLFDNLHVASENPPCFGRRQTQLQQALSEGQPVVFLGLETNPELQQALESLCCDPPSIIINGMLRHYPQANINLLWEKSGNTSPLWTTVVQSAECCVEKDMWESVAVRHGIDRDSIPKTALDRMYEAFATIPKDLTGKTGPLPALTESLLDNLIIAARQAQGSDGSTTLEPAHWRKAINSVLTHGTRQNPSIRDFMKVVCERLLPDSASEKRKWVDPERLAQSLRSFRRLDRSFVENNFWQLARALDPMLFQHLKLRFQFPNNRGYKPQATDVMCAILAVYAPEDLRESVVGCLRPDPKLMQRYEGLPARSSLRKKRLDDALASGWGIQSGHIPNRFLLITTLADECYAIATGSSLDDAERKARIKEKLEKVFIWQGAGEPPLDTLAEDLLHATIHQESREQRRIHRLKSRLAKSPAVFIQGETGTGKSYFAARMAEASGPAVIVSTGPSTDERELVQRWYWRERQGSGDRYMERVDQALLKWARMQPDNEDDYVTLVMDEANLSRDGLLDCLKGLWREPACIYAGGQPVEVSSRHRVIFTGNPDSYAGRHMDKMLQSKACCIYYPPLDLAFLRDRVIEPALYQHLLPHCPGQAHSIAHQATESVLALWQHYQALLPDHEFTPRDLTDICSRVGWYLNQTRASAEEITVQSVNALVLQGFRDAIGQELDVRAEEQVFAMECWFHHRFPSDNALLARAQNTILKHACHDFRINTSCTRPEFDTSSAAVTDLSQQLIMDLLRCQQAYCHRKKHGGRQATLIEGPAGRGKDVTLQLLIDSVSQQARVNGDPMPPVRYLNACDCTWDVLRCHIQKARSEGEIVVISEMNLIDSQHQEGELNDILAGDAAPGFHLFATTNPPHYSGRKPLSPALKGRFRYLPIRQYNQDELTGIARKALPDTASGRDRAAFIADLHCRLRHSLQKKNIPLQPTGMDLQKLAHAVSDHDKGEAVILELFSSHYRLYLLAAKTTVEELLKETSAPADQPCYDRSLCQWLNKTETTLEFPWLVIRGKFSHIAPDRHIVTVPSHLSDQEARVEVVRQLAETQWRESGIPVEEYESCDSLKQTLYWIWQHHWFNKNFKSLGVPFEQAFPLTDIQKATLAMDVNQPYVVEVSRLARNMDVRVTEKWPAYWQQIRGILQQSVFHFEQQEPEEQEPEEVPIVEGIAVDNLAALPLAAKEKVDANTDYEHKPIPVFHCCRTFKSNHDLRMYRLGVYDLTVTPGGALIQIRTGRGEYGFEIVIPGVLPDDGVIPLARDQYYGVHTLECKSGEWLCLPGLSPHETITSMRIDTGGAFHVIKDRYTGLHMLFIPDAKEGERVDVHYVLNTETPSDSGRQPEGGQKVSRPDATCQAEIRSAIEALFSLQSMQSLPDDQRQELLDIDQADSEQERIRAISRYCRNFRGTSKTGNESQLTFLLKQRQGACSHRSPVFIAFCRYYGIPARIVRSEIHSFPEFSLDNGQTWNSEDLGGAPGILNVEEPACRPATKGVSHNKRIRTLEAMSPWQIKTLATVLEVSPAEVSRAIQSGTELPVSAAKRIKSNSDIVRKLWEPNHDESGFLLGSALLCNKEKLDSDEVCLAGNKFSKRSQLASGVELLIHPDKSPDSVLQELQRLHAKIIGNDSMRISDWQYSMLCILENACRHCDVDSPPVIAVVWLAFGQEWVNPYKMMPFFAMRWHKLLKKLEAVEEIKPLVKRTLQDWYNHFPGSTRDIFGYMSEALRVCKSHHVYGIHGGKSPAVEAALATTDLSVSWTEEPEGIPDIGRLLSRNPAFPVFSTAASTSHRPVIALGSPIWRKTELESKTRELIEHHLANYPAAKALFDKKERLDELRQQALEEIDGLSCLSYSHDPTELESEFHEIPEIHEIRERYAQLRKTENLELSWGDEEQLLTIKEKYSGAIQSAFTHYLYQLTNSKGGRLTCCWVNARCNMSHFNFGSHRPVSPEELMWCMYKIYSSPENLEELDNACLRKALKSHNGLILKHEDLTIAASEFMNTIDLEALFEEVVSRMDGEFLINADRRPAGR